MATNAVDVNSPQGGGALSRPVLMSTNAQGAGGSIIAGVRDQGQGGRTMDALMKLAGDALTPHIKAASQEQFLQGLQQAASGQGLKEIVENQPWYTEIFGPSSAGMGARTYTTQAAMAKFGSDMEKAMPELAKQGPEALMQAANGFVQNLLTGDSMADATIMSGFVDQLQPLFKRHAKENYIYTQNQANAAQVSAWDGLFDTFQQRAKASTQAASGVSAEDVYQDGTRLLGSLSQFPGQSDESYHKNILNTLTGAARKGNFHAIKLIEDQGILKSLPPEQQAQLQNTFRAAGREALNNAMPDFAMDVAMFVNDTAQDPRGIVERMQKLNAKAAAATGVSLEHAQLIPSSSAENIVGNVLRAQASELVKQANKGVGEALAYSQIIGGTPGSIGRGISVKSWTDADAEKAMARAWAENPDPVTRARMLERWGSSKSSFAKDYIFGLMVGIADKEDTKGVQHAAAIYNNVSPEARGGYWSADQAKFIERYTQAISVGSTPEQAHLTARLSMPLGEDTIPPQEKGAIGKAIRSQVEKRHENMLGWNQVDDQSLRTIEAVTHKMYKSNRSVMSTENNVAFALTAALDAGQLEIIGKHAVLKPGIRGQASLPTMLSTGENNMGAKEVADRFEKVLEERAEAIGMKGKDYTTIIRTADVNGDARFILSFMTPEGRVGTQYITGSDLRNYKPKPTEGTGAEMGQGAVITRPNMGNKPYREPTKPKTHSNEWVGKVQDAQ